MIEIQDRLTEGLDSEDSAVVRRWLAGLADATRLELAVLRDDRGDTCSRSVEILEDGRALWHAMPILRGRFVRPGEVADDEEWRADYFEYLLDHPEIWIPEDPAEPRQSFHIGCTAHRIARDVLATGRIPDNLACPLENDGCPMRDILRLKPGHAYQLSGFPAR